MQDSDCVEFLQWALPQLHRRWQGFRKVRAQVCKRIDRRCKALDLAGPRAYRDYLERHPAEWEPLDRLCPITISSFYRDKSLHIVATDVLPEMLERARQACYSSSSLKLLPEAWRAQAFEPVAGGYCLRAGYRQGVEVMRQDVRTALPDGRFNLILCRNLVFTYFDEFLQRQTLERILTRLRPGGALVIGRRETLPSMTKLTTWSEDLGIFRKLP